MPSFPQRPLDDHPCPSCGARRLVAFYEVTGVPVHSNLLMPTREAAVACPTGDLRLALCRDCGFITNTAFDPRMQEMTDRYEGSQAFSPTFNAFAKSLVRHWADRYQLAGKQVVEIGCGRGEFVALLCEIAGCRGVGFDPTLDLSRVPPAAGRVRWVVDRYSDRYADVPADFICCRHTLEHVPQTAEFVRMVRGAIGNRTHVVVAFEVPDTLRVLREGAFWDLYYEHCSYFTPASLARLFELQGFELLDLRREFGGQYLVLEAKPVEKPTSWQDVEPVEPAVEAFRTACDAQLGRWRQVMADAANLGRRVAVWGAGSKAVGFLTTLGVGSDVVSYVVDINPHKQGTYLPGGGQEIVPPERLHEQPPDLVIVMNPAYREEIADDLRRLDVRAEVLTTDEHG